MGALALTLVALIAASPSPATHAATPTATPTPAQWSRDLGLLKRGLVELHPGLNRYLTPAQFEAEWAKLERDMTTGVVTLPQGYRRLSEFTALVQCGHLYLNFFNQEDEVKKGVFEGQNKVPFAFQWIDGKMVVTQSFVPGSPLKRGTVIERLNGHAAPVVLNTLLKIARADGANPGKRTKYLEINGIDGFEAFDIFFPLYFPMAGPKFSVDARLPGASEVETFAVTALSLDERTARAKTRSQPLGPNAAQWSDRMLNPQTAYLNMPGWAMFNTKWDWNGYLQGFFDRITAQNVPNLIIDIRDNEGGNDVGLEIMKRLADREIKLVGANRRFVKYRKVSDDLVPFLGTWDRSFRDWGAQAQEVRPGWYALKRPFDNDLDRIPAAANPYRGKVFVLMSATNSSATFQFLQQMKAAKLGTLIGQSSGGNQRGINGGAFFFMTLPESKIEVDLPLIGYFPEGDVPNAGIEPDIPVKRSAQAIAEGRDLELEAALMRTQ